ncbi:hypothetical protein V1272_001085 [Bradyrhizobium sp. AZCC 1708]
MKNASGCPRVASSPERINSTLNPASLQAEGEYMPEAPSILRKHYNKVPLYYRSPSGRKKTENVLEQLLLDGDPCSAHRFSDAQGP